MKRLTLTFLILLFASPAFAGFGMTIYDGGGVASAAPDTTPPTLTSATIPTTGTTMALLFGESVSVGAGGNGGWVPTLSGGACTATYSSGSGTTTLTYSLGRTVNSGETGTISYTQPGNGIEDAAGNDLATIASAAITNNSTQSGATVLFQEDFEGEDAAGTPCGVCVADCDGYDASGDYCDDDTTQYHGGAESLGIYGPTTAYVRYPLSVATGEFYADVYVRLSSVTSTQFMAFRNVTSSWDAIRIGTSSGGYLRVYYNNSAANITGTSAPMSINTWYHIRIYYKEKNSGNNGIVQAWIDDTPVTSLDRNDLDTGDSHDVEYWQPTGPVANNTAWHDDVTVYQGAP